MKENRCVHVRAGRKGAIRPGHPWIFKTQLARAASTIRPGDIVSVKDGAGKFIGRGYYNPKSEITIRLLTFTDEPVDRKFFYKKITASVSKRKNLLPITNAYRAVFSEADGLPGLIIDIYNDTAVLQALTLGMDRLKSQIVDVVDEVLKPAFIYEKSSSPFRKLEGLKDVTGWWSDEGETTVEIFEGKAKFLVDIANGHKTGFYLDQRRSRLALENISKNRNVLDLFCYTGAFAVSASVYGAKSVKGVDIKEEWLALARKNAELNGAGERTEFLKGDSFEILKKVCAAGEKFDMIILDPPSFLKSRESMVSASKGYKELNTLAMKSLSDGGVLATFSCSHSMPNEVFSGILKKSAEEAGRKFGILKRCHQAEDHPILRTIPETEYLKGYFLKL